MRNKILVGIMIYTTLALQGLCLFIKTDNIDCYISNIYGKRHLFIEFLDFANLIESTSLFILFIACLIVAYAFTLSLGFFGLMPWILEKEDHKIIAESFNNQELFNNPTEELKDAIERQKERNARAKK
jgi:hypothetical protein